MKTDNLTTKDIRNLALQRTGSLFRFPLPKSFSPSYVVWQKFGSNAFLDLEARVRRAAIIQFSVEEIRSEFERMASSIAVTPPLRIMDIGCGLGMVDVLFAERFGVDRILLVDIEENDRKHHGFADQGAAYNSLDKAERLVSDNIAKHTSVQTVNPRNEELTVQKFGKYNLIISLISCGFHYPADTYFDVFDTMLDTGGRLILDLRRGEDHRGLLSLFEVESEIEETKTYHRVILRKMDKR